MSFKIKRLALTVFFTTQVISGFTAPAGKTSNYDWTRVINAIIQVESEGDERAVSGQSCGAMQITPILVRECNDILAKKGSNKRYTLRDRFSVVKSKEMFHIIQSHFNPENNVEKAIRLWNGGNRYKVSATNRYYRKVLAAMK